MTITRARTPRLDGIYCDTYPRHLLELTSTNCLALLALPVPPSIEVDGVMDNQGYFTYELGTNIKASPHVRRPEQRSGSVHVFTCFKQLLRAQGDIGGASYAEETRHNTVDMIILLHLKYEKLEWSSFPVQKRNMRWLP
jgi:hypothetical protein